MLRGVGIRTATTVTNTYVLLKFEGYKKYTGRWGMAERDRKKRDRKKNALR